MGAGWNNPILALTLQCWACGGRIQQLTFEGLGCPFYSAPTVENLILVGVQGEGGGVVRVCEGV